MWRACWGNLSKGFKTAPIRANLRFMQTSIKPIASFRWPRWPFQKGAADKIGGIQRKMLYILAGVRPRASETPAAYVQRRRSIAGGYVATVGKWSRDWARSLKSWHDHVERHHDPWAWSWPLLHWHDSDWLKRQREAASSVSESRTRTRVIRARPQRRWEEGLRDALPAAA